MEQMNNKEKLREEIFCQTVRAGRRMYFFDVKSTRENDYYIIVTESKKKFEGTEGKFHYEKHKLFIYKEDFEKFAEALNTLIDFIKTGKKPETSLQPETDYNMEGINEGSFEEINYNKPQLNSENFTDITFEDLKAEEPKENE